MCHNSQHGVHVIRYCRHTSVVSSCRFILVVLFRFMSLCSCFIMSTAWCGVACNVWHLLQVLVIWTTLVLTVYCVWRLLQVLVIWTTLVLCLLCQRLWKSPHQRKWRTSLELLSCRSSAHFFTDFFQLLDLAHLLCNPRCWRLHSVCSQKSRLHTTITLV